MMAMKLTVAQIRRRHPQAEGAPACRSNDQPFVQGALLVRTALTAAFTVAVTAAATAALTACAGPGQRAPVLATVLATVTPQSGQQAIAHATAPAKGATQSASTGDTPLHLRLIAFNDFHGQLESGANLTLPWPDPAQPGRALRLAAGGAAHLAGTVQALRASAPHSLVISSGDLFGATPLVSALFLHESTVDIMNRLGVDLAIPGNHEFDAGRAELLRVLAGTCRTEGLDATRQSCPFGPREAARFAVFAANIHQRDGGLLFAPSVVRDVAGVKIGFVGAVTRITPAIVVPSGVAGLRFSDEARAINAEAARLKAQGVHNLVAVVHEGGDTGEPGLPQEWNDSACPNPRGAIFEINKRLSPDIAVVFSAHTHQGYRCMVDGRPILQATAQGRGVSVVDLAIDRRSGLIDRARSTHRNLPVLNERSDPALRARIIEAEPAPWAQVLRDAQPDATIAARVAQYAAAAAPLAQRPLGRIVGNFGRTAQTDSAAGRLVADSQWRATQAAERGGAQLALMNPGGVRTDLRCTATPPCTVTYGDAFSMQPFGNNLVVMTLTGAELQQLLEDQQRPGRSEPRFLIPSADLRYRWVANAAHGQRVQNLQLAGQPVLPQAQLRITVNSFLADGGDGFFHFKAGRERLGGELDLDALALFLRAGPATPDPVPRISWVD